MKPITSTTHCTGAKVIRTISDVKEELLGKTATIVMATHRGEHTGRITSVVMPQANNNFSRAEIVLDFDHRNPFIFNK